ncbi:MAG: acetoacetate--CoA ligase [Planctomycetota bacterium]|jgi:acetoacetyl-CoA synthetase
MTDVPLWQPPAPRIAASNLTAFMRQAERRTGRRFQRYDDLHAWSIAEPAAFWATVWDFVGIVASQPPENVLDDPGKMPGASWFGGARLNFAENLLRHRDDRPAIVFRSEAMTGSTRLTHAQLHDEVARVAAALRDTGVEAGDRVVGFMPNLPQTVIAMLAAASRGAIWSSCSPDFGVQGVLDRFARLEPKVLFTADAYRHQGRTFPCLDKVARILADLGSSPRVIVVPHVNERPDIAALPGAVHWSDCGADEPPPSLEFTQLPFAHPVYIMYSSGTTGAPKCIVQPAGGVLINQLKEHVLHVDMRREDVLFYYTTCSWMMWNWLVAALGTGASIVLYDGSPFRPDPEALWRLAEDEGISVFGTSASYLAALEKAGRKPGRRFDLSRLRAILSTGSPLSDRSFEYVYRDIKADLCLASISGGTDLNGCFVGGCPILPVHRGEIQCKCLGMDVRAWDDEGRDIVGRPGELVCATAFPSMPIGFWGDEDGSAYRSAYFERFGGVWTHGDYITINDRGGIRISGRSDATLNPGGVRIGTAEIYRQVEPLEGVDASIVIAQKWRDDIRVVLFVKLAEGRELTEDLKETIRAAIRANCSPKHVPDRIVAVGDIPYTRSGKKVELAVRSIVHGERVANLGALRNPEALECYADLPELKR